MTKFELNKFSATIVRLLLTIAVLAAMIVSGGARAAIDGITGTTFNLTASEGYISIADGGSVYSWGYSTDGTMQLPGPTLIVSEGATVTVTLKNSLPKAAGNVSIIFSGHQVTMTAGGELGLLAQEATSGGSVAYTFTAGQPGTYQYHSGTRPDLQVEMGLYGALIVRPRVPADGCIASAYAHSATCFDREYLFLLSEVDIQIHQAAEQQSSGSGPIEIGTGTYQSEYWLLNGRAAPDTMAEAGTSILKSQPYNAMVRMHPGERILMRVAGAGREMHPFHFHGNHARVLARDGRLLLSATNPNQLAGPNLFTIPSVPGGTVDAIFEWTGKDLGWDIYGTNDFNAHDCIPDADGYHNNTSDDNYREWCADHNREIPVVLPNLSTLAFGGFYGGSPYLGVLGSLPPGEGGLNPNAGFAYMWHSHTEREMVNNDIFPGGMMTMLIIEAPWVDIP
ncbi:multicopper oxidase family protein [Thalassotalea sp. ND16A]|uniref:multicopper oxidase family protein n=1 Tax=Thalassotalea sp. ND16A TaxID=1535422 RepID=UPI00051A0266|nr:multicopper oxidase family protein [Thalassotalea sp. ND16A]KGJ91583.1 hypothetical protein ND16A_1815 [Thalassotalea sp. ND16A]